MDIMDEILKAIDKVGRPRFGVFWYCPLCDIEDNSGDWRMVAEGSPLIKDGVARCPDCGGELSPVSEGRVV